MKKSKTNRTEKKKKQKIVKRVRKVPNIDDSDTMVNPSKCKSCFTCGHLEVIKGKKGAHAECRRKTRKRISFPSTRTYPGFLAPKDCGRWILARLPKQSEEDYRQADVNAREEQLKAVVRAARMREEGECSTEAP